MHSPDSGIDSRIPPVPPIPAGLSSALSHTRHLSTEVPRRLPPRSQSLRVNRVSKTPEPPVPLQSVTAAPSNGSTSAPAQVPPSGGSPRPPLPQPQSNQSTSSHNNLPNHSLDKSSSPPRNSPPNPNPISSNPAPANTRRSQLPPSLSLPSPSIVGGAEGSSRLRPTPHDSQDEPQRTGASSNTTRTEKTLGSATSGEDITKVLTAYRFASPLKSSFQAHIHESPDPSTPSSSPWSDGSRSHRTDVSSSTSLPQTPDSGSKHSRNGGSLRVIRNATSLTSLNRRAQRVGHETCLCGLDRAWSEAKWFLATRSPSDWQRSPTFTAGPFVTPFAQV